MKRLSEKQYLTINPPTEEDSRSDHQRLIDTLSSFGYSQIHIPLTILQHLHTTCIQNDYNITVTLIYKGSTWTVISLEGGDTTQSHYGLAVDYGSTTIIMELVDLNTGESIAQVKEKNGQIAYGTDILTRITYTMEDSSHMKELQMATIKTFHQLFDQLTILTGIDAAKCPIMVISGNTTMIHFLLCLDAKTVFFSPYAPVTTNPGWFFGKELNLDFAGIAYIMPAASNYIGGDIISGLLNMNLQQSEELQMFFDIGTNGELVLGNRDWLLAGAGAAGPALEGYISRYGMRAAEGAIDTVQIEHGRLTITTIGNKAPIGICGSGIIDLLAQLRLHGWINIAGEINPEASSCIRYLQDEQQYVVVYADETISKSKQPLYFSQTDIHQYLDTKAAAFTMIDCLLSSSGYSEKDISRCYLSGAFCAHSNLESAITIGIFPDLPREKYTLLPNSSLSGARILLMDRTRFEDIQYLTENLYCVQFASIPDFLIRMQAAKFIPHTDMQRYPSIQKKLDGISG